MYHGLLNVNLHGAFYVLREATRHMRQEVAAINGIMAIVVEDHIQVHMVGGSRKLSPSESKATNELIDVLRTYIK